MAQDEDELINALTTAESTATQRAKKIGALFLASLAATTAFLLQGLWSVGGLRKKWFVPLPEYNMVYRIWQNKPLSPKSAQKVMKAYKQAITDWQNFREKYNLDPTFKENPIYQIYENLKININITDDALASLIYNPARDLYSDLKKIESLRKETLSSLR
jgi:hypothetical protein